METIAKYHSLDEWVHTLGVFTQQSTLDRTTVAHLCI